MLLEIYDPKAPPRPIGIDLGTTHSLVARMRDGQPHVIEDCNGDSLIPSVVHYAADGQVLVGQAALDKATEAPTRTVASIKRFMGKGSTDIETERLGSLRFVPGAEGEGNVVRIDVGERTVTPVEASAEILRTLRALAVDELRSVGPCVITVPAYFDDAQRQATKDAAKLAGLDVLRLLNEPTAAALAYGIGAGTSGLYAVYDLGGGTFDITVLHLNDGIFEVKATGGNSALGGDDMDRALAELLLNEMPPHARSSPELIRFSLKTARALKHALTDAEEASVALPLGAAEKHFSIRREQFDAAIAPIVDQTLAACRRALKDAGFSAHALTGVILVGGATRVPLVRRKVEDFFGKVPLCSLDPDKVVAMGAAIQADQLAGERSAGDVLLLDVIPLSLGLETMGGVAEKILPRNTTIPSGARQTFTTYADNQTGFDLHVVQGERELARDCRSLARFTLKGIPPMPAGMARLEVTFTVDADGLLHVAARELTTGIEQAVDVTPSYGLTDDEVEAMLMAALDHGEEDLDQRRLIEERVEAARVILATEKGLAADADLLDAAERTDIEAALRALQAATEGSNSRLIHVRSEALDEATRVWAGKRMDRAVGKALAGRTVGDVATEVDHAKGVDAHVADHSRGGSE